MRCWVHAQTWKKNLKLTHRECAARREIDLRFMLNQPESVCGYHFVKYILTQTEFRSVQKQSENGSYTISDSGRFNKMRKSRLLLCVLLIWKLEHAQVSSITSLNNNAKWAQTSWRTKTDIGCSRNLRLSAWWGPNWGSPLNLSIQ